MTDYMDNMMGDEHRFWKGCGMDEKEWIKGWEKYAASTQINTQSHNSICIML